MKSVGMRLILVVLLVSGWIPAAAWAVSSSPHLTLTGSIVNEYLGFSVATAGDVNGDGYADLIVGAYGGGPGRAYVYFGGPAANTVADLVLQGAATGDQFGYSVGPAGDMNGDGYADVIVGAPQNDFAGVDAGRAYVFFGGPIADTVPDLTLSGAAAADYFGYSVNTAGDVNGDGYDDVVVGAFGNDAGGVSAGRAYVFRGGPGPDAVADVTLTGAAGDYFGYSVGTAGDVNGDGRDDVIVGAPYNDAGGVDAGRAYVFFTFPAAISTANWILGGAANGDRFGHSVSAAGDTNGDGFADVIVGAPYNDGGGTDYGRAYVYYGSTQPDALADMTLTGLATSEYMGSSVRAAGDVNGDGYTDVIAGAPGGGTGRAYVFLTSPSADFVADVVLTGEDAFDSFGASVGTAGDVNGDGYADVIAGAAGNDSGGSGFGRAYVRTIFPYQVLTPNGGEQWVAGAPAVVRWRGHGPADIAVSADGGSSYSTLVTGAGGAEENEIVVTVPSSPTAYAVVRVSQTGVAPKHSTSDASDAVFRIVEPARAPAASFRLALSPMGAAAGDYYGNAVGTAGDVNGDGHDDVIVGARWNGAGGFNAGRAYLYHGGPGTDGLPDLVLTGSAGEELGYSVGAAGDVNGDGYDDVIVGADRNAAGGADAGAAYVYFGGPGMDAVADLTLTGQAGELFGGSVGTAGDMNGDGYSDVVVGAPGSDIDGTDAGRAYAYYGGPAPNATADRTFVGGAIGDRLGACVSTAGDMNGDGFSDVIVGALYSDAAGTDAGRVLVFYGGSPSAFANRILNGAAAYDRFGASLGSAGDVNGDGYSDIVVGAPLNDGAGTDAGRAYTFFGGPGWDDAADWIVSGTLNNQFGQSVASAGDVNRDGFSDLIVGAYTYGGDAGRAYVYYGGARPDAAADFVMTGDPGSYFGIAVASAGDMNADGFSDIVVGAYAHDGAGFNAGRAYVYDSNRYFVRAPNGGETWNVGAMKTISWSGAEPADVWLSIDGGDPRRGHLLDSGAGGADENAIQVRVPHTPTKFARIHVLPSDPALRGSDGTDSLFTIQTSIALLSMLAAPAPGGGVSISWSTDPGPEDLSGYRLERSPLGSSLWSPVVALTGETSVHDPQGGPGTSYRLFAVNGFGEELWLGEASLRPALPLAAWPLPYRGGTLTVSFATYGGLGGGAGSAEVTVFDVSGRLVRSITKGAYAAGHQTTVWDGRDESGRKVAAGIYLLRAESAGQVQTMKLAVLR